MGREIKYNLDDPRLKNDIRERLRAEFPDLGAEKLEEYINGAMTHIGATEEVGVHGAMVSYGVNLVEQSKKLDDLGEALTADRVRSLGRRV